MDASACSRSPCSCCTGGCFYGYTIAGVASFAMFLTSPGQTFCVSQFVDVWIDELRISRSVVGSLYLAGTLTASVIHPFTGRLIDRWGTRWTMTIVACGLALSCGYMNLVVGPGTLVVGFFLLRFWGQGSLMLVAQNACNQWWDRRRGSVMGVANLSMCIALAAFPNAARGLIPAVGWRGAYLIFGAVVAILAPVAAVLMRHAPEEMGLRPDGDVLPDDDGAGAAAGKEGDGGPPGPSSPPRAVAGWTLREAARTRTLYIALLAICSIALFFTAVTFHLNSILAEAGLPAGTAGACFVPMAVTGGIFKVVGGAATDRWGPALVMAFALATASAAMAFLAVAVRSVAGALAFGALMGVASGCFQCTSGVVLAHYFGRAHLGRISSLATFAGVAGSAVGPLPFALAKDATGSYTATLVASAAVNLAAAAAACTMRAPAKPPADGPPDDGAARGGAWCCRCCSKGRYATLPAPAAAAVAVGGGAGALGDAPGCSGPPDDGGEAVGRDGAPPPDPAPASTVA